MSFIQTKPQSKLVIQIPKHDDDIEDNTTLHEDKSIDNIETLHKSIRQAEEQRLISILGRATISSHRIPMIALTHYRIKMVDMGGRYSVVDDFTDEFGFSEAIRMIKFVMKTYYKEYN